MGESKHEREVAVAAEARTEVRQVVNTLGERMHICRHEAAAATPHGQLVF